jgi:dihydropteroate synthase
VSEEEEMARVLPAIERIGAVVGRSSWPLCSDAARDSGGQNGRPTIISVDTSKASVARAAIQRGASIINDVTGLRGDPDMLNVARETGAGVIIMHMQGTPRDMQRAPHYQNVIAEIREFFRQSFERAVASGIEPERIAFDPGIGFGKAPMHNLLLIKNLAALRVENRPLVLGVSRKSFIGKVLGSDVLSARDLGTAALTALGRANGANIFRVHDVSANVQALRITEAVLGATESASS